MSQQFINIGATPNDGLGDPIRTAFQKTNNNFSQLFPIANVVAITGNGISVTGNVSGNYFIGNGAFLTGISSTYGNANVANYLPTFSGNLTSLNTITATGNIITSGAISTTGNISGNNITANNLLTFANLAVSGGTPLVATDTTIAFKIPVVINGTTYYISLTAAQ
jgi:hypothetical protein